MQDVFVIRKQQRDVLADDQLRRLVARLEGYADPDRPAVEHSLRRWRDAYGVCLEADVLRALAIARRHGLGFDLGPENDWIRRTLGDPDVSSMSRRLDRLEAEQERRARVAQHNEHVERSLPFQITSR
jgi:hypothetical protein